MKRLTTLFLILLFAAPSIFAQWPSNENNFMVMGKDSVFDQSQPKVLHSADGRTVMTWLRSIGNYTSPSFTYSLNMQILDNDGKPMLGKEGITVSDKPSMTYTTDYDVKFAPNGDILMAYYDKRTGKNGLNNNKVYLYRYDMNGNPVWDANGIEFVPQINKIEGGDNLNPMLCVNGKNIYAAVYHNEYYMEKADSSNWQPTQMDSIMPDSVLISNTNMQVQKFNDNGVAEWSKAFAINSEQGVLATAPDGTLYCVYIDEEKGCSAVRLNEEGKNMWDSEVVVEPEALTSTFFVDAPVVTNDDAGGLIINYRKLTEWSGYVVMNHLTKDGQVYDEAVSLTGDTDGDGTNPKTAYRDDHVMTIWAYENSGEYSIKGNLMSLDEDCYWAVDNRRGIDFESNTDWGFVPIKVIPKKDGWVLLYGNGKSWNGADFMIRKINDDGETKWVKRVGEPSSVMSFINIANDDRYAYIAYSKDADVDNDGNYLPGDGGLRLMRVSIMSDEEIADNISTVDSKVDKPEYYSIQGYRLKDMPNSGIFIVKTKDGIHKVCAKK